MLIPHVNSSSLFSFSNAQGATRLRAAIWEVHHFFLLMLRLKEMFNLAFFWIGFGLFFLSCQMRGKLSVDGGR